MINQVLLDQDGIIADFVGQSCLTLKRDYPYRTPEAMGCWEIEKLFGLTAREFWKAIDSSETFWSAMPKTPDADELVQLAIDLVGVANVGIATAAHLTPNVILGKRKWIAKYYPRFSDRIIIGRAKEFMGGPNRLLIDDKDSNCEAFRKAGGHAILVPRHWNSAHTDAHAPLTRVKWELEKLVREG